MRYFLDTEFDETPTTLTLLSLALKAQDDRELYLVSSDFSTATCSPWIQTNVLPHLLAFPHQWVTREKFAGHIEGFLAEDANPEFWGYYSAYDWFLFCRLWGGMLQMPKRFPKMCGDIKQTMRMLLPDVSIKEFVPPEKPEHNALADARWNALAFGLDSQAGGWGAVTPTKLLLERYGIDARFANLSSPQCREVHPRGRAQSRQGASHPPQGA